MYSFHIYAGTHNGGLGSMLMDRAQAAIDTGLPVFMSELGTTNADGGFDMRIYPAESDIWVDWMNSNDISWTNWSLGNKSEASAALRANASTTGDWNSRDLTPSGIYIRWKLLE